MTSAQLRAYAKANGIDLAEARERVKLANPNRVKGNRIFAEFSGDIKDPVFIEGDTIMSQMQRTPMGGGIIVMTPGGMSNQSWGVANVQIFGDVMSGIGDGKDDAVYSAETECGKSYNATRQIAAYGEQPGFRIGLMCDGSNHEMCIAVLGDWKMMAGNDKDLEELVRKTVKALPRAVNSYVLKHFLANKMRVFIDQKDFKVGSPPYVNKIY